MKYKIGDLLLVKDIHLRLRPYPRLHPRPLLRPRVRPGTLPLLRLHNTFGIITEVEKHSDIFEYGSTEDDNGYVWYSQMDNKEYYFYQDEIDGEVIE